jgi:uncharacterized protein involved in exopolysaccharide biosynthesis
VENQKFNLLPYLQILYKRRLFLAINLVLITAIAFFITFFILKKEYLSKISFLPPVSESGFSIPSIMGISLPSTTSEGISPEQFPSLFDSRIIKKQIIDHFDLIKNYKLEKNPNKIENAIKILNKKLTLEKTEIGSVGLSTTLAFTLKCFHTSPDTARQMVDYTFLLLDSATRNISIDRAHRNRVFIETQQKINMNKLDSLQSVFQEFQVKNKAYDIPEQLKLSLQSYSEVKGNELFNDIKLKSLQNDFKISTPEIEELQSKQQVLQKKLQQIENEQNDQVITGLNRSTKLLPEYINLMRSIEMQNQVILLLTKELEQAKLQEAKNISPLMVIDPAYVPEYKARPKRIPLMAMMIGAFMGLLTFVIFGYEYYRMYFSKSNKP